MNKRVVTWNEIEKYATDIGPPVFNDIKLNLGNEILNKALDKTAHRLFSEVDDKNISFIDVKQEIFNLLKSNMSIKKNSLLIIKFLKKIDISDLDIS